MNQDQVLLSDALVQSLCEKVEICHSYSHRISGGGVRPGGDRGDDRESENSRPAVPYRAREERVNRDRDHGQSYEVIPNLRRELQNLEEEIIDCDRTERAAEKKTD